MFKRLRRLLRRAPHQYEGSGFSVSVQSIGRELARVSYTRAGHTLHLDGDCYGGMRATLFLRVPRDLAADSVGQLVKDLAEGLAKLGYGYQIYRTGERVAVPEEERRQALAELRAMGMDAKVEGDRVITSRLPGFQAPPKEEAAAFGIKMMGLARTISGQRVPVEVLARGEPPPA